LPREVVDALSPATFNLGILVDSTLNMSEQCAAVVKKASRMLGCINKGITSGDKEVIIPLYSAIPLYAALACHTWNIVFSFGPPLCKKYVDRLSHPNNESD